MSFEGKVVLITGASSGIGADAARHLAKLGAKVAIVGRNGKRTNETAEQIRKAGSPAPLPIVGDITKDAERIINETIKHFGKLDVLVNNAGIVVRDSVESVNFSDFDRVFDTNVRSMIGLTKLSIPHLEKTKGNIVNISSVDGLKAVQNNMTYGMSKAAVNHFTKSTALDLAPKGIRVNCINPAIIRTPIFETFLSTSDEEEKIIDAAIARYPLHRVGNVSDTSEAIAFLANDKSASFITGLLLTVDGGSIVAGTV